MGFRLADAVPVRHRKIFPSDLPGRARSSSRMSMGLTGLVMIVLMSVWLAAFCFLIHRSDREENEDIDERLAILRQDFLDFQQQQHLQYQQQHRQQQHCIDMPDPNISVPYQ